MSVLSAVPAATIPVSPCAACGTGDGLSPGRGWHGGRRHLSRYHGERFGVAGWICATCHQRFSRAQAVPPCACCSTSVGLICGANVRPSRYQGERFGYAGKLCARCYARLAKRRNHDLEAIVNPPDLLALAERQTLLALQVERRTAIVRAAKDLNLLRGFPPKLTTRQLARLFPGEGPLASFEVAGAGEDVLDEADEQGGPSP